MTTRADILRQLGQQERPWDVLVIGVRAVSASADDRSRWPARGILYHDGQFDDSRYAISLMQTFQDLGGTAINYVEATGLLQHEGKTIGIKRVHAYRDQLSLPGAAAGRGRGRGRGMRYGRRRVHM